VDSCWPYKVHVIHAEGCRQFVKRNYCRISTPLLKPADVLLTKAGELSELLLG